MTCKNKIPKYKTLRLVKNSASFLAGIIVSGYVVGISLNPENTYWHWLALVWGVIIGLLLYILIAICNKIEDNVVANTSNNTVDEKIESAWREINRSDSQYRSYKIFGILPKVWKPAIVFFIPILFITGICFLHKGNQENYQQNKTKKEEEQTELVNKIGSINKQTLKNCEAEENLYRDSLRTLMMKFNKQAEQIDSLENIIRSLKEIKQQTKPQKKKIN